MKALIGLALFCFCINAAAQNAVLDSVSLQRVKITKTGTLVLGGWGVLNLGTGLIGRVNSSGEQRGFHQANAIWGGVNLLFAGLTYLSNRNDAGRDYAVPETFSKQSSVEKLFLFNTALDVGYVVFGLYTKERANRYAGSKAERLRGTGASLLVQGCFLTIFDGTMYLLHAKNGRRLNQLLQNLSFGSAENGVGLTYRF